MLSLCCFFSLIRLVIESPSTKNEDALTSLVCGYILWKFFVVIIILLSIYMSLYARVDCGIVVSVIHFS